MISFAPLNTKKTVTLFVLLAISLCPLLYGNTNTTDEVLIYYANETSLNKEALLNYQTLSQWLNSDSEGKGPTIAQQIWKDLKQFPAIVDQETKIIEQLAPQRKDVKVALFTNNLSRQQNYKLYDGTSDSFKTINFPLKSPEHYISASQPNAAPSTFQLALQEVLRNFNPQKHKFSLIIKSHGSRFFIMVPRITIRHELMSKQRLLGIVNGNEHPNKVPDWMQNMGTTREDFFNLIQKVGINYGMEFNFIFTESCKSRIGIDSSFKLPTNISMLISPSENLEYSTIDYQQIFKTEHQNPTVTIGRFLKEKLPNDFAFRKESSSIFDRAFPYWSPLILLILIGSAYKIVLSSTSKPNKEKIKSKTLN
ncbi:MAG: hypothetical protein R3B45_06180 [Bdellovibrionota bacterium]